VDDSFANAIESKNPKIVNQFARLINLSKLPNTPSSYPILKRQICSLINQDKHDSALNEATLTNFLVLLKTLNTEFENKN
jgi:hypothetical protein